MGDTLDYVDSVVAYQFGRSHEFIEPGHLLWRPAGWIMGRAISAAAGGTFAGDFARQVTFGFIAVSWVLGLVAALTTAASIVRLQYGALAVVVGTTAVLGSHAFLNFSQAGASYIPGLGFSTLALYLLVRSTLEGSLVSSIAAGLCAVMAAGLWLPYTLTLPALVMWPLLTMPPKRRRGWLLALSFTATVVTAGLGLFAAAALAAGVRTSGEFVQWLSSSSHGITLISGAPRALLGFARSFVSIDEDGILLKRFLLHDPYANVSLWDVATSKFWRLGLFYLTLAIGLVACARRTAEVTVVVVATIPVVTFGIHWQGGDLERYLPLVPFAGIAVATASSSQRGLWRALVSGGVLFAAVLNVWDLNLVRGAHRERVTLSRLATVPKGIDQRSVLLVSHLQDDLMTVLRRLPYHELNVASGARIYALISPNMPAVERWAAEAQIRMHRSWSSGGRVLMSTRLLAQRPQPAWSWVEGDDRRVSWNDLHEFAVAATGRTMRTEPDGFVELARPTK